MINIVSKILDLLKIFSLAQSVNLPNHTHGHILDWIVYRPDDKILVSSAVSNELTSDHFKLLYSLDLRIPDPPSVQSSFLKLLFEISCMLNTDACFELTTLTLKIVTHTHGIK